MFDNFKPLLPVLNTAKKMFYDKPADANMVQGKTDDIKKERASFIQQNPVLSLDTLDANDEMDDNDEINNLSIQTHAQYQAIIYMYHNQSIEMAKLLDTVQQKLYNLQLEIQACYATSAAVSAKTT